MNGLEWLVTWPSTLMLMASACHANLLLTSQTMDANALSADCIGLFYRFSFLHIYMCSPLLV